MSSWNFRSSGSFSLTDCHIIFDGIQAAQDEVEEADGHQQLGVEFLDDGREGARGQVEEVEA
jgi:hypothetical protein